MNKLKTEIKDNIFLLDIPERTKFHVLNYLCGIEKPNTKGFKLLNGVISKFKETNKGDDKLKSIIIEQLEQLKILLITHPNSTIRTMDKPILSTETIEVIPTTNNDIEVPKMSQNEPKQYNKFGINQLQKYDVIKTNKINLGVNYTPHYAVVYKVIGDLVYCVSITSKEVYGKIKITKSRMFKESGFFVPTFLVIPIEEALESFAFIYDTKKEFDNVIEVIKKLF